MVSKNFPSISIMISAEYFLLARSLSVSAPGYLIYKYFVEIKRAIKDIRRVSAMKDRLSILLTRFYKSKKRN